MPIPLAVRLDPLPPPDPALGAVVVIPARDEADLLPSALRALVGQIDSRGEPLDRRVFEVIVFANNCTDRTAAVARAVIRDHPDGPAIIVVEAEIPREIAHVGTARRWLMDRAADRLEAVGRPAGLILSTDADTVVAPNWVAAQLAEAARGADAVAGLIEVDPAALLRLGRRVRRSLATQRIYRGRILQLEALIDPNPLDPPPRHDFHGGASLGITAQCYRRAGGLPPLRSLEDVALVEALWRLDARLVHSSNVRVRTSPRLDPRAEGGHGAALAEAKAGDPLVRSPEAIEAELRARAALRRLFQLKQAGRLGGPSERVALAHAAAACGLTAGRLAEIVTWEPTFGRWLEAIWGFGPNPAHRNEPRVALGEANRTLRTRVRTLRAGPA